jgi:protease I
VTMSLTGLSIVLLIANGFNEAELTEIQRALVKTGAKLTTVSPEKSVANGWFENGWGHYFPVDQHIGDALGSDFDIMVLVGGERGVAKLAGNPHTKRMVSHFLDAEKPLVAINEAVTLLSLPGKVSGRHLAGDKTDPALAATGAQITDGPIVVDRNLLTIQSDDITQELAAMLEHFAGAKELAAA